MKTNADMTLYQKGYNQSTGKETYTRVAIAGVYWESTRAANILKSGMIDADSVTVYVPFAATTAAFTEGDIIVKGTITKEITDSYLPGALLKEYPEAARITTIDTMDAGSLNMRHWQIGAK